VPDTSGIGALPLPRRDPLNDPPKFLREFVYRIRDRFAVTPLTVACLGKQRFESARRLYTAKDPKVPGTKVPGTEVWLRDENL
jgi:hypothetical protein